MPKVLVTGGAGFIGFHCSLALKKRGDFVIGLDQFNTYYSPLLKRKRAALLNQKQIEVIEGDFCNRHLLQNLVQKEQITHILHLGAQAGVRYARTNPDAYIKSNIEGFLSILETCRTFPHLKLLYASSSSVYGTNTKQPFSITDTTDHPANLYAATKKSNELMAYSYHHLYNIEMTGLRYFTVYGPWGRPDMAYFLFSESIMRQEAIHLFNNGQMKRDFTYIDDVVQGTLSALDKIEGYDLFNIGNNRPEPLLKLVTLLEKGLGKKAITVMEKQSPGEVITTYAAIDYTKQKLGFNPKTTLEEGLTHFVKWFKEEFSSDQSFQN